MTVNVVLDGLDALFAKFDRIPDIVKESAKQALLRSGDAIGTVSKMECPRGATGYLERSFFNEWDEEAIAAVIGYSAEYAIWVHEMLDPTLSGHSVNWTKPGSKNKFLEDPYNRYKDAIPDYVARAIEQSLAGGLA